MRSFQILIGLVLVSGTGVVVGHGLGGTPELTATSAGATPSQGSTQASGETLPKDIHPDTGNRLPAIKREALDDTGKKLFDLRGPGRTFGPGGIRLYSPPVAAYMSGVNDYLQHKSRLDPRLQELAILVAAREMDCQYEWTNHEPMGLKAGLPQQTIDIVKYRKSPNELEEKEKVIIQLGREAIGKHQVSSGTAARAQDLFGNQGLVNYVSLMCDYASTAILLSVFDQHVHPTDKPLLPIP
jgi:4-carboxymuconolactone decarboxylase